MRGRVLRSAGGALLTTGVLIEALSLALVVVRAAISLASAGALLATSALVAALPPVLSLMRKAISSLAVVLMFVLF
jgi:hypothetical protein